MLEALGLTPEEEAVYRQLVAHASSSLEETTAASELSEGTVRTAIGELEAKGLAARTGAEQLRYVAAPPAVALGALLAQRQEELRRAQEETAVLTAHYRGAEPRAGSEIVDVVHGTEAIAQRFAQLQHSAREQVQILVRPEPTVVTREDNLDTEMATLARGVAYDSVLERTAFADPGFAAEADIAVAHGMRIRIAPAVPLRVMIVDREIALVPVRPEGHATPGIQDALLVHPSGLLDGLLALFDLVWQNSIAWDRGRPGPHEGGDELDPLDARVVTLLLAGLTDQAIGSQLGVSLRTVQRRVRGLMDDLGVETRLQLGYQAARHGWV